MAGPEGAREGWAATLAWWRGLPGPVKVALPAFTLANVMPVLSLSEHVMALHGFVADAVAFYQAIMGELGALIHALTGVRPPRILLDGLALYLLVVGTFLRTAGPSVYGRAPDHRWRWLDSARLVVGVAGPFVVMLGAVVAAASEGAFTDPDDLSPMGILLALVGVGLLYLPVADLRRRRRRGEVSAAELARRRGRLRLFYGSLAASLLLFAMLAAVNAGLARA